MRARSRRIRRGRRYQHKLNVERFGPKNARLIRIYQIKSPSPGMIIGLIDRYKKPSPEMESCLQAIMTWSRTTKATWSAR